MKNTLVGIAAGLLIGASIAPAGAHHGSDLQNLKQKVNRLQNKVSVLGQKTQNMDRDGFYLGPVLGNQVIGVCAAGSTAVWEPVIEDITMIDDCLTVQRRGLRASFDR